MKMPRTISIAIAVISAMVTIASSQVTVAKDHPPTLEATPPSTLGATPQEFVYSQPATAEELTEALRLAHEHCKKLGKVTGQPILSSNYDNSVVTTIPCVGTYQTQ